MDESDRLTVGPGQTGNISEAYALTLILQELAALKAGQQKILTLLTEMAGQVLPSETVEKLINEMKQSADALNQSHTPNPEEKP